MKVALRSFAIATALAIGATALPVLAARMPTGHQDRDNARHDDNTQYQNSRYYQMGTREGQQDYSRNKRMDHRHRFNKDEDRQAYEAGYQQAWSNHDQRDNNRNDRNDENRPH
jgi:hypothetical protein